MKKRMMMMMAATAMVLGAAATEIGGDYVAYVDCYTVDDGSEKPSSPFQTGFAVSITQGENDSTFLISNFIDRISGDVRVVVDMARGTFHIPEQTVGVGGLVLRDYVSGTRDIAGTLTADGALVCTPLMELIEGSGEGEGTRHGDLLRIAFRPANAYLEAYSVSEDKQVSWAVVVTQDAATGDVIVDNFSNAEVSDTLYRQPDGTWLNPATRVIDWGELYGAFTANPCTIDDQGEAQVTGDTIACYAVGTDAIEWGSYIVRGDYFNYGVYRWGRIRLITGQFTALDHIPASPASPIATITYYDLMGRRSTTPHPGLNIVVTTHQDGSHTTAKVRH